MQHHISPRLAKLIAAGKISLAMISLASLPFILQQCEQDDPPPVDSTAPVIESFTVQESARSATSGVTLAVTALVSDDTGVSAAQVAMTQPDGSEVMLELAEQADGSWSADTIVAPALIVDQEFSFVLQAEDAAGNSSGSGAVISTVQGARPPSTAALPW